MIKLRVFRWEDYLALSRWTQCHHKRPYKSGAGGSNSVVAMKLVGRVCGDARNPAGAKG